MKTNFLRTLSVIGAIVIIALSMQQCKTNRSSEGSEIKILFLHHSTGDVVYKGTSTGRIIRGIRIGKEYDVPAWFSKFNSETGKSYSITEKAFPKGDPYKWNNYPFDYYNIWVKNAGDSPYMEEPTLEMLTREYDLIIFKHCYPVCDIKEDSTEGNIDSEVKTINNYKLQYNALKKKMREFPDTKFVVWTGAVRVKAQMDTVTALRASDFFEWVRSVWDEPDDNIFLWDFYELETEGGLFLKESYAEGDNNSHPTPEFGAAVAPLMCQRVVDVIETNGTRTLLNGKFR
ncbi:MAG TPA: hypothetical protein PKH02_01925 [Bacteroidales bacterium]|jgi:hypothetical protein|nr:hypothetical protein [Bacteroidales bacterium]